jgi:hypothetical protein
MIQAVARILNLVQPFHDGHEPDPVLPRSSADAAMQAFRGLLETIIPGAGPPGRGPSHCLLAKCRRRQYGEVKLAQLLFSEVA